MKVFISIWGGGGCKPRYRPVYGGHEGGGAQCILKLWGGGLAPAATTTTPDPTPMESKPCQTWNVYFNWEGGDLFVFFVFWFFFWFFFVLFCFVLFVFLSVLSGIAVLRSEKLPTFQLEEDEEFCHAELAHFSHLSFERKLDISHFL